MHLRARVLATLTMVSACQQTVDCGPCFTAAWVNPVLPAGVANGAVLEICAADLPCTRETIDSQDLDSGGHYSSVIIDLPRGATSADTDGWKVRGTVINGTQRYATTTRLTFMDEEGTCACDHSTGTLDFDH
ncbi:MAG TPA: hypothetical protein VFG63_10905 [Nocardioidaceae bacterium]|nr:hypothetical protein [Nocardioidaceae bacterium]